ncbi:hypothetical protein [Acetivibrio straminisolvens]|uniref:Uncharacterized protein n=2 Tax=Acetivibrio straminisolvens TaxID=253314 RepID=W4V7R6_9FIRM|nr:hypothetical protein [Acetivibrio straminisolvens]GAE88853.1 hypothetical protein JCM21531_2333 [Acetivibrio straminisolvens JCM 21531]
MDYKFISENTLEYIYLHDCIIDNVTISDSSLIFEFDHIDVFPEHPLNNYPNAKCTGNAALIFEGFEVIESILFDTNNIKKMHIIVEQDSVKRPVDIIDLAMEFLVLQSKWKSQNEQYFLYEFHGTTSDKYRNDFGMFTLKFSNAKVCWNELLNDSWFVNRKTD